MIINIDSLRRIGLVFAIFLCAFLIRTYNVNWDADQHLHPDERFLTMVVTAMSVPESLSIYLDQATSTMNPANLSYKFYVYGTFPLIFTKLAAQYFSMDSYTGVTIVGRYLSAFLDSLNAIFIFWLVAILSSRMRRVWVLPPHLGYWAALIYALMVLPIQLGHFFTTDTFTNTFFILALVLMLSRRPALSGLAFGLSLASKVSAIYTLPLLLGILVLDGAMRQLSHDGQWRLTHRAVLTTGLKALIGSAAFVVIGYIVVRIANPYYFEYPSFLNPTVSRNFISSIQQLQALSRADIWFPPAVQWITKTRILFPLQNIVVFGIGIPLSIFALLGAGRVGYFCLSQAKKFKEPAVLYAISLWALLLGWMVFFFLYQGMQFAHTMRYFLYLYPLLAIFAALGVFVLTRVVYRHSHSSILRIGVWVGVGIAVSVWAIMFMAIYSRPHSRVSASEWIWQHIPEGSAIAWEHWDDPLPLQLPYAQQGKQMAAGFELPVFGPDNEEKWKDIDTKLASAEYYILSSNRAWGSVGAVPSRYPRQSEFYKRLFAGQTAYVLAKSFTSYPGLCLPYTQHCLDFPDDWAEEAFTVYDHPKVLIYKNTKK